MSLLAKLYNRDSWNEIDNSILEAELTIEPCILYDINVIECATNHILNILIMT